MDIEKNSENEINQEKKHLYVTEKDIQSLNETSRDICNGFCIILDIKDSTKRKKDYRCHNKWIEQTRVFYNAFNTLNQSLIKIDQLQLITEKFIGDGVMSFFKDSNSISTFDNENVAFSICFKILKKLFKFKEEIESEINLCKMKIKVVVTYLTDIHIIQIGNDPNKTDVLGLGIDFSFRIAEFADIGYIVINDFFFRNLIAKEMSQIDNKINIIYGSFHPIKIDFNDIGSCSLIPVERYVKGWPKPQSFRIIVNEKILVDMIEYVRDDHQHESIYKELLSYYCSEHEHEYGSKIDKEILSFPTGNNKFENHLDL